ncbi:MAG: hypothetical protein Q4A75_09330 [Peptostreptococcaceae bacterium]|nr:hypothetical protein [Peptostreptococcaceae bacterium]
MEALFIVLNKTEKLDDLMLAFAEKGITGGTILESKGMAKFLYSEHQELPMFGSLYMLMNDGRPMNKTIFMLLRSEKVALAKEIVKNTVGDLNQENMGIMFTVPVSSVEGLTK